MHNLFKKMLLVTGSVGGSISLVVVATASFIIPIMFGPRYYDSIPVLKVLYLSVPLIYLKMVSLFSANSIHLEKRIVKIMTISVIVNIILNSIAIPLWGALGAAWATVISEMILAVWLIRLNFGQLRISRIRGAVAVPDRYLIIPTDR
jgi:O-antigen/teichoic acid export membrane protein